MDMMRGENTEAVNTLNGMIARLKDVSGEALASPKARLYLGQRQWWAVLTIDALDMQAPRREQQADYWQGVRVVRVCQDDYFEVAMVQ